MNVYEVLRRPLVTEKSTLLKEQNRYAFEVARGTTKNQVKEAVEAGFKVKVAKVNVMTVPGKRKRFSRRELIAFLLFP